MELFSEVMAKLLGVAGSGTRQGAQVNEEEASLDTLTPDKDPKQDGRVQWLISEIGGRHALGHRDEDMRRKTFGRGRESGYRTVQLEEEDVADLPADAKDPHDEKDNHRVWLGLLTAAESEFEPNDHVLLLLDVMANDPEISDGFSSEWPITQIADALNLRHSTSVWDHRKVENAKKRLGNWIGRLKRDDGLDLTDLMALFAQHARLRERDNVTSPE